MVHTRLCWIKETIISKTWITQWLQELPKNGGFRWSWVGTSCITGNLDQTDQTNSPHRTNARGKSTLLYTKQGRGWSVVCNWYGATRSTSSRKSWVSQSSSWLHKWNPPPHCVRLSPTSGKPWLVIWSRRSPTQTFRSCWQLCNANRKPNPQLYERFWLVLTRGTRDTLAREPTVSESGTSLPTTDE